MQTNKRVRRYALLLLLLPAVALLAFPADPTIASGPTAAQQRQWPPITPPPPPPDPLPPPPPVKEAVNDPVELSANLVTVTVVVRDQSGKLVTDLDPKDFVVYEDGKAQDIDQIYRQQELPLKLMFLFDSSLSIRNRLDFERQAAGKFFSLVLRPGDQAGLIAFSTDWTVIQPLTTSAPTLVDSLKRIEAQGITSLYSAMIGSSKILSKVDGRRVMLLLSDGYDTAQQLPLAKAVDAAQRADSVVYAISPFGRGDVTNQAAKIGEGALLQLTDQTGGSVFFIPPTYDEREEGVALDNAYQRIIDELRAQYVLAYYSNEPTNDGRFRELRVEVRRPGLTVRARRGYYAKNGAGGAP